MSCVAYQHPNLNIKTQVIHKTLVEALSRTGDVKNVVALLHVMSLIRDPVDTAEEKPIEEDENIDEMPSRFLTNAVYNSQAQNYITDILRVSSSSDNPKPPINPL